MLLAGGSPHTLALPAAQVMVLVASCPTNPGKAQNLLSVPKLEAVVTYNEPDNHTALTQSVAHDLKPAAQAAADAGQGQSLIIAVVYLDQPGVCLRLCGGGEGGSHGHVAQKGRFQPSH
jgi:hypothetical protein